MLYWHIFNFISLDNKWACYNGVNLGGSYLGSLVAVICVIPQ